MGIWMKCIISKTTAQILLKFEYLIYIYSIYMTPTFDRSRKAGTVFLTTQGSTGQEVRTLTKHRQDVFDKT